MKKSNQPGVGKLESTECRCVCVKTVSHEMQQILYSVAKLPKQYVAIRKECLKGDYLPNLTAIQAREAFLVMIGEKDQNEISSAGQACYRSMTGRVEDFRKSS